MEVHHKSVMETPFSHLCFEGRNVGGHAIASNEDFTLCLDEGGNRREWKHLYIAISTLSKFKEYHFYVVKNCNGNTATVGGNHKTKIMCR